MSNKEPLQTYLDGNDKVSVNYQTFSKEKPSAELNERILEAARNSVGNSAVETKKVPSINYRQYSIAASICLSILVVSMFINNEPLLLEMASPEMDQQYFEAGLISEEAQLEDVPMKNMSADTAKMRVTTFTVEESIMEQPQAASMKVLADLSYRNSVETWLFEIQRLMNVVSSNSNSDEADKKINEERRLFTENYPEINLIQALSELETMN